MKFETILSALEGAIDSEHNSVRVGNRLSDNPDANRHEKLIADRMFAKADRRVRQSAAFRARLLSMYSGDILRLVDLENAWAIDETIQPDGSLRPSLADTVKRAAELEAEIAVWKERAKATEQSLYGAGDPEYLIYCTNAWDAGMASMTYIDWLKKKSAKPESEQPPQAAEGGRDG